MSTSYSPFAALPTSRRAEVEQLLALLQLADGLDRARDQAVTGLDIDIGEDHILVGLRGAGLHVARTEFDRKASMFERVYGRPVVLTGPN